MTLQSILKSPRHHITARRLGPWCEGVFVALRGAGWQRMQTGEWITGRRGVAAESAPVREAFLASLGLARLDPGLAWVEHPLASQGGVVADCDALAGDPWAPPWLVLWATRAWGQDGTHFAVSNLMARLDAEGAGLLAGVHALGDVVALMAAANATARRLGIEGWEDLW